MSRPLAIRGYAAIFDDLVFLGGEWTRIAPCALDEMVDVGRALPVNFFDHDEPMRGRTFRLFRGESGLAFEAVVRPGNDDVRAAMVRGLDRCSLLWRVQDEIYRDENGAPVRIITRATADHLTVCSTAVFHRTSAWVSGCCLDQAPRRLYDAAENWEIDRERALARARHQRVVRALQHTRRIGGAVAMMRADARQGLNAKLRRAGFPISMRSRGIHP